VPGPPRSFAVGFPINNKIYVGGGFGSGGVVLTDLYEFDPISNLWTTKSPVGFAPAQSACFVVGNKGYISTGYISAYNYHNDLWEYDPVSNVYSRIDSFAGGRRCNGTGFAISGMGYVGFGVDEHDVFPNDLYEYIPNKTPLSINEWNVKEYQRIYPNPSSGIFNVSLNKIETQVNVIDVLGNCVLNKKCGNELVQKIDLSDRSKGIYLIQILSEDKIRTERIVIE
jgi:N-acetylneuraminic acid mutarotase